MARSFFEYRSRRQHVMIGTFLEPCSGLDAAFIGILYSAVA